MIKLGLVQTPAVPDAAGNLETLRRWAAQGKAQGCQAICFPEASLTGYAPEEAARLALTREDAVLRQVSETAVSLGVDLLAGFMERSGERLYLTHGLFLRDGGTAFYRKTHLGQRERRFFTAGDRLDVFDLSCGLRAGVQLCVETHFPEITQTLSLKGAQVVFAPHAVPRAAGDRQAVWRKYIPARAYDNRVYLACCNQWDPSRFPGGCLAVGPNGGECAAFFEDRPGLAVFSVDPGAVQQYHMDHGSARYRYFPGGRRPELYR